MCQDLIPDTFHFFMSISTFFLTFLFAYKFFVVYLQRDFISCLILTDVLL